MEEVFAIVIDVIIGISVTITYLAPPVLGRYVQVDMSFDIIG
jgi:hypothetical protein